MDTLEAIIFGASCGLFIIIMTLAVVAAANRSRVGNRIISGFPTVNVQLRLIVLVIVAAVVWAIQAFTSTHTLFIVFTAIGMSLIVNPSVLGDKGLKFGIRFVPRDRIDGYTIESKGSAKAIIYYQIQGRRNPLAMVVDEKRNKDLQNQLLNYFGGASVPN